MTCRRCSGKPSSQIVGQLPRERVTPGHVFDQVGVDYAGPSMLKLGHVRKPTLVKSYVCIFVSMSVKAVHLEAVTDLTTEGFISTLKRFIARRSLPAVIFSDNGTNFVRANNELKQIYTFLSQEENQKVITEHCSRQRIQWRFIPEHAPHFGGLCTWESAVKSMKTHLKKVIWTVKLNFEELTTILAQIEACLNSRPLTPMTTTDGEEVEALTPGHFLIGKPLCALPHPAIPDKNPSLLKRWRLCQYIIQHFWK